MAVINRTECFFNNLGKLQGLLFLVLLCGAGFALANPQGCEFVKDVEKFGLSANNIHSRPTTGLICGENSCCNNELEQNMSQYVKLYVDKFLRDSILKLASLIDNRAKKFNDFFLEMMSNSKLEFHKMFKKTYGKIYMDNSDVFSNFFLELEKYYKKGAVQLTETMDTFFGILYQRMFIVLNSQYTFEEKYLECVADHMTELKPFGDVPSKLGVQLGRSFVATRTFYKALEVGHVAVSKLANLEVEDECLKEMTRMQFCGICKGQQGSGACSNYCHNTLETCLGYHQHFSSSWDNYVDAIEKVADRLLGPYNIEAVVEPINIKISEAIMNFQEAGAEVSAKIFNACGKLSLRQKRKAEYPNPPDDNHNEGEGEIKTGNKKKKSKKPKTENITTLDKLIQEIKTKVKDTKAFWLQLPYQYCNNQTIFASHSGNEQCWNGTSLGAYVKKETTTAAPMRSTLVDGQVYTLNVMTEKLKKAYHGQDVELIDEEENLDYSGSGSGDGDDEDLNRRTDDDDFQPVEDEITTRKAQSSTAPPVVIHTSSASSVNKMCLTRALVHYLLPIVLAWFGGAITDLL